MQEMVGYGERSCASAQVVLGSDDDARLLSTSIGNEERCVTLQRLWQLRLCKTFGCAETCEIASAWKSDIFIHICAHGALQPCPDWRHRCDPPLVGQASWRGFVTLSQ